MHHHQNHHQKFLSLRVLTLASILLAVMSILLAFETNQLNHPAKKSAQADTTVSKEASQSSVLVTGPDGCTGVDQCLEYCQNNPLACAKK